MKDGDLLRARMSYTDIMELTINNAGERCDQWLDAEAFAREIERGPFARGGRKALCEYLGIGESTLSGWLKEGRMPRSAKLAYVLLIAVMVLQQRMYFSPTPYTFKIVRREGGFQLCRFVEGEYGAVDIEIVADSIKDVEQARHLAVVPEFRKYLNRAFPILDDAERNLYEYDEERNMEVDRLLDDIENFNLYLDKYQ